MKFLKKYNESETGWSSSKLNDQIWDGKKIKELLSEFKRCSEWIAGDLDEYPNCVLNYYYNIKPNFKIVIIGKTPIQKNWKILPNVYLEYVKTNGEEVLLYLNSLFNPYYNEYLFKSYNRNKYTDFAIKLGLKQLEYFDKLEKFPKKKELELLLIDINDDYKCTNIKFGYFKNGKEDDVSYVKDYSQNNIGYIITYEIDNNSDYEDIEEKIEHLRGRLDFYGNYKVNFKIDEGYQKSIMYIIII